MVQDNVADFACDVSNPERLFEPEAIDYMAEAFARYRHINLQNYRYRVSRKIAWLKAAATLLKSGGPTRLKLL
jgi:hypothetical protein